MFARLSLTESPGNTISGAGLGLRSQHYRHILEEEPAIAWFEVLTENYFGAGGLPHHYLQAVRDRYPITFHGVGMSLGATDPLNRDYLARLRELTVRYEPVWISDHIAWISSDGAYVHDLLPLPYTEDCLRHLVQRISQVQEYLGERMLVENPSTYLQFDGEDMSEPEFMRELAQEADCYLLLDVNNVHVSATNHGFDAATYVDAMPASRVREIHLAGYEEHENYLFDTHGKPVHEPVWDLYRRALRRLGPVPTLIEWDTDIPAFDVMAEEAHKASACMQELA